MNEISQHNSRKENCDLNIPNMEWSFEGREVFISFSGSWSILSDQKPNLVSRWNVLLKESIDIEVFHLNCSDRWLCEHITCPMCRQDIRENPDEESHSNI